MRFLGNKESMVTEIYDLLNEKGLVDKGYTLFDAFGGTGTVADYLKNSFNVKVNDLLTWSVIYSRGRILANDCTFEKLGFNPIDFFNSNDDIIKGFFFENYSPGGSERMYFNEKNAGRIDYFRQTIEQWFKDELINYNEYCYLLASLMESISLVSNTAGVYGAFLKHWDSRALKDIEFVKVLSYEKQNLKADFYNSKIEDLIEDIECDVLYLDPPYTQNQYGTQYHLLETLVLYDNPSISPVTGSRKTAPMRSDWSRNFATHILLDKVLAKTKAKYIVLSYNVDGFMSKQFIESCFKRYGKIDTFCCKKITYKKYRNFKTKRENDHYEYLFFIEKKDINDVTYESPLNYIGSKSKMIPEMKTLMPSKVNQFLDLFGGGFNVGININSDKTIYNDTNWIVKDLVKSFRKYDTYEYLMYIQRMIKRFGLEASDRESYIRARDHYNSLPIANRDPRLLYTIILYGFQQQIRFNSNHDFNNPVGMRWFNDRVLEKMVSFSRAIKEGDFEFTSLSFEEYIHYIDKNTFVYMDPPYRLTNGSYNDGKRGFGGWTVEHEQNLMDFADELNESGVKFMISYVLEHQGEVNNRMKEWLKYRLYKVINLTPTPGRKRKEVVIINYELP